MKRVLYFMSLALVAMIGFSSCSDDEDRADVLSGEWEGDWNMWYTDSYGRTWYADNTYIRFDRSHSTAGTGTQVDYYRRGPYEYLVYRFRWSVNNGNIYLDYPYDPELNTAIRDYTLSNRYFDGYFGSSDASFTMDKISNFSYWTPRVWVSDWYGYTIYTSYGSNGFDGAAGSKAYVNGQVPEIVKRGGHTPVAGAKR